MGLAIHKKRYLIAIPIPFLDRNGRKLNSELRQEWEDKVKEELGKCFGGTIPIPAPAPFFLPDRKTGKLRRYYEEGQTLILSGCDTRNEFLAKQDRIERLADAMAEALNQASVFVLAAPSDSFLVEVERENEP